MKECIEREAALEAVDNADVMCDIHPDAYRVLRRYIKRIPAADVRPVVHGTVILKEDGRAHCSHCDCSVNSHTWNYCPNCGARMDGEGE